MIKDLLPSEIFTKENQYQFEGLDAQSYFLLKEELKPVFRCGQNPSSTFLKFCQAVGLRSFVGRFEDSFYGQKIEKPLFCVYLSFSLRLAKLAYQAEKVGDRETVGKLLGYPSCCVKSFIKNYGQTSYDLTIVALLKTKTYPSFYCHSIFTFDSKIGAREAKIYQEKPEIWRSVQHLFLIRHAPCSFDCKESIRIGRKTLEILRKEMPTLAQEIESALKRPVLYFDYFRWLVFDGEIKGNQLKYKQILPYPSLFPEKDLNLIKRGNHLAVKEREISVFLGGELIGKIKKENKYRGLLIDFK